MSERGGPAVGVEGGAAASRAPGETAPIGPRPEPTPTGGDAAVLDLAGVVKRYRGRPVAALDGVDLRVDAGQVLALLGPNGAGKSTLVGIAAGLVAPDAGQARVTGVDPRRHRRVVRRRVGLAPQEIGLYPPLTVVQNLRAFGEAQGLGRRAARARAHELLEPFALTALAERATGQLSGGERRRVHAAAALVARPRLVLLDEPTAGADPQTRNAILAVVRAVADDGAAVVYTTHYLPEVEQLGADVALLEAGRIIARDPLERLIARHAAPALLLRFAGAVPPLVAARGDAVVERDEHGDERVRIAAADPATALRELLVGLGDGAAAVTGAEIVRPSLEAAYLALTGRRTADEPTAAPDADADGAIGVAA